MTEVKITRQSGVAGQVAYTASTEEGDFTFVGNVYGGPIVLVVPTGYQTFVTEPERFGQEFDIDWVKAFVAVACVRADHA